MDSLASFAADALDDNGRGISVEGSSHCRESLASFVPTAPDDDDRSCSVEKKYSGRNSPGLNCTRDNPDGSPSFTVIRKSRLITYWRDLRFIHVGETLSYSTSDSLKGKQATSVTVSLLVTAWGSAPEG